MAVPVVASISPTSAVADGSEFAYVIGTGFADAVEVRFGEAVAAVEGVFDEGANRVALVRVPKAAPGAGEDPNTFNPGVVDITLQNLDEDGLPIPGEVDVIVDAFTMTRTPTSAPGSLSRVVGQLLLLLRREVIANVTFGVAVDYDADADDGVRVVEIANTPAIVVSGPSMTVSRVWRRMDRREAEAGSLADVTEAKAPAMAYDIALSLNIATEAAAKRQLYNLIDAVGRCLNRNKLLSMLAVDGDPESETLRWPMVAGGVRTSMSDGVRPNVAVWELTILGVQIDSRPLDRARVVDETLIHVEAI